MKNKKILKVINDFENLILEILFPTQCLFCGKRNPQILCEKCFKSIELLNIQKCPSCEKSVTEAGKLCHLCQKTDYPIKNLLVATDYKNPVVAKSIHFYKYRFIENLYLFLGEILVQSILKNKLPIPDLIIPVPLHSFRLRSRGYNQSELLGKYIGENLTPGIEIPVENNFVKRIKYTPPQMKIKKYSERKRNVLGVFQTDKKLAQKIKGKKILIVDDVCTTGSTLIELAKTIQPFHPRSIFAVVIARQS